MLAPVTKPARDEQSHTVRSATSSAVPMRPIGCSGSIICALFIAPPDACSASESSICVSIPSGRTEFTRTPCFPYSRAAFFVSPFHGVLGRHLGRKPRESDQSRNRSQVDDCAAASLVLDMLCTGEKSPASASACLLGVSKGLFAIMLIVLGGHSGLRCCIRSSRSSACHARLRSLPACRLPAPPGLRALRCRGGDPPICPSCACRRRQGRALPARHGA